MSYTLPEAYDSVFWEGKLVDVFRPEQMHAAFEAGRASRDAEVEALKTELREGDDLRTRLSSLLTRSVNAIRGEPEPLHLHSWHDLPELVEALRADAERLDWIELALFGHSWNGVMGSGSKTNWRVWDGYRHVAAKMIGNTFREAIDAARAAQEK